MWAQTGLSVGEVPRKRVRHRSPTCVRVDFFLSLFLRPAFYPECVRTLVYGPPKDLWRSQVIDLSFFKGEAGGEKKRKNYVVTLGFSSESRVDNLKRFLWLFIARKKLLSFLYIGEEIRLRLVEIVLKMKCSG